MRCMCALFTIATTGHTLCAAMQQRTNGPAKNGPTGPVTFKIYTSLIRSSPGPLNGAVKLKNADNAVTYRRGDQRALPRLPLIAAVSPLPPWSQQRENERPLCVRQVVAVGSGGWFVPCLAGPNQRLLIPPTVMAGVHMHSILRSARQQHGLLRLYAAYVVCEKRRAVTGAGPKKDPRPVRSSLGPARPRTGNQTRPVLTLQCSITASYAITEISR